MQNSFNCYIIKPNYTNMLLHILSEGQTSIKNSHTRHLLLVARVEVIHSKWARVGARKF